MKAVAIPYVIALLLGIAVIGLIGFLFVIQGGKFGGESTKAECQSKLFQFCASALETDFKNPNLNLWDTKCKVVLGLPGQGDYPRREDCV